MSDITTVAITAVTTLASVLTGAAVSVWVHWRNTRIERGKILATSLSSAELAKARLRAYQRLWKVLGRCSTYDAEAIVAHLPVVRNELQSWYYENGGGLLLGGAYEEPGTTKDAFFQLRDLQSSNAQVIWERAHELRQCLRRDLGIYERDDDEQVAVNKAKAKLDSLIH